MDFLKDGALTVVAEAGVNHNGDPSLALKLVDAAADAGADAVKFQTFKAEALTAAAAPKAAYQEETTGGGGQLEMLRKLELSPDAHRDVQKRCEKRGIRFLSTPFDEASADFLDGLGMSWFKVPSGELTNLPFLRHLAAKGKPMLISTGMSDLAEVEAAVEAVRGAGAASFGLMHCVSSYPAPVEESNLRAIETLKKTFGVPVGWSDHTSGFETGVAAVALGATVLEKHFTLDKSLPGPDHRMSLSPEELEGYVGATRAAFAALGDGVKAPRPCELPIRDVARRSVVLVRDCAKGQAIESSMLALKRPGTGIAPSHLEGLVGRKAARDLKSDEVLAWEMLEGGPPA